MKKKNLADESYFQDRLFLNFLLNSIYIHGYKINIFFKIQKNSDGVQFGGWVENKFVGF